MFRLLGVVVALVFAVPNAWAANTIKIGVVGPMAFVQGEDHWAGAELARDAINSTGGVKVGGKKREIELVKVDTNEMQSVADATNALERAVTRDKVDFLVGGFRSEAVLAMQAVAMDTKKLFIGCGAADAKLGENVAKDHDRYKYWFRLTPLASPDLGKSVFTILATIAGTVRKEMKTAQPKVAILAEKVVWTEAIVKAAQAKLPAMKMKVVGTWQPSPVGTDVTAELAAIERAGADIIFTVLSGPVGVVVGRQMGERRMKAIAFGINVEAQKDGFLAATNGKGNYVSTLDTYGEAKMTPKTLPFIKAFKKRFGRHPTYTAGTHDALYLLKTAIEKAGSLDADKLVKVLETTKFVTAASNLEFTKTHDPAWGIGKTSGVGVQWQNGKKVPFWPPGPKGMGKFKLPSRK